MELTYKALSQEIADSSIPLFVECWASWCLPCKQYDAILKKLASEYEGLCKVYKINVDRNPQMSKDYVIRGLPMFIAFFKGQELMRKVGAQTSASLDQMIEGLLLRAGGELDAGMAPTFATNDKDEIIEQHLRDLGYL